MVKKGMAFHESRNVTQLSKLGTRGRRGQLNERSLMVVDFRNGSKTRLSRKSAAGAKCTSTLYESANDDSYWPRMDQGCSAGDVRKKDKNAFTVRSICREGRPLADLCNNI